MIKSFALLVLAIFLSSCSYLKYSSIQAEYKRIQNAEPGQVNLKHMIDRDTYFVYGKTEDHLSLYFSIPLVIAAYSSKFKENERVDTMYSATAGTHYGLNLPEGSFTLLVLADINGDRVCDSSEVIAEKRIVLNKAVAPEKILGQVDITLDERKSIDSFESIQLPENEVPQPSLFYPAGTIRSLRDPIFDERNATLGMYDPASFMEMVPTMFYALEEDMGYKIPVIFIHGIGGTSRAFEPFIKHLDRSRYRPWFFYYPSGGDLDQLADLFYRIFLSGNVIPTAKMPMILIAHSMGGLVAREALNKYNRKEKENNVELLITIASPFGGHPAAATGEKHGLIVLPAWRDVNPDSRFIRNLYRKPLPAKVNHLLVYAFNNPNTFKLQENSDGVVPLSSQLHPLAQNQSQEQFGFNSNHTDILKNEDMIQYSIARMNKVENFFPKDHLSVFDQGGYDVELNEEYSPLVKYIIRSLGKYYMAITNGTLTPFFPEQEQFLQVVRGEIPPTHDVEKGWIRFLEEYPELKRN